MTTVQRNIFTTLFQIVLFVTVSSAQTLHFPFQGMTPALNATGVDIHPLITISFTSPMLPSSFNPSSIFLYGELGGKYQSVISYDQNSKTLSLTTPKKFLFGEQIHCILTDSIGTLQPYQRVTGGFGFKFLTGVLQGTGQFTVQPETISSPSSPYAIAAGDFNGDGFIDCAVTQKSSSAVSLYMNTHRNGFLPPVNYTVGTSPEAIVVADVNGDGHPDIVVANRSSNNITVLTNNGSGIFSTQSFALGKEPVALAVADCNNDGSLDLAVVTAADSMFRLVRYDNNTITPMQSIALSGIPSAVLLDDFNNDGYSDAAVTLRSKNKLLLFKSDSLNYFSFDFEYTVGTHPEAVIAYDAVLGSDGYVDLATINSGSNNISILKNDHTGRFQGPEHFDISGTEPAAICGNDFDGDGDVDLAISCKGSTSVTIFRNNGVGLPDTLSVSLPAVPQGIVALDITGSYGIMDLIVCNTQSGTLSILRNGFFSPPAPELSIERDSLYFAETALNDTAAITLKLLSQLSATRIDSVQFSSRQYHTTNTFPLSLSSYDSASFTLYYAPQNYGDHKDSVIIYSTAGVFTIRLTGESPLPQLTLSNQSVDFGEVKTGDTLSVDVKLKNFSINTISISSISNTSPAITVSSSPFPVQLKSMDSSIVTIKFIPPSIASYTDTVLIICDPSSASIVLPVRGSGTSGVGIVERDDRLPSEFALKQNFPNPFNPATTIHFSLPSLAQVNISVYDISGKMMSKLADGEFQGGNYSVQWNGSPYASGLYYYRMRAQSLLSPSHVFIETKKLLLIK